MLRHRPSRLKASKKQFVPVHEIFGIYRIGVISPYLTMHAQLCSVVGGLFTYVLHLCLRAGKFLTRLCRQADSSEPSQLAFAISTK